MGEFYHLYAGERSRFLCFLRHEHDYSAGTAATATAGLSASTNFLSGCMVNERATPSKRRPIETAKGKIQFPVKSTIAPKASGDTIAAIADPVFINPLAVPEYCGAISIGIDQIGPITSSRKK